MESEKIAELIELLTTSRTGMRAGPLANRLSLTKSEVNSYLYSHMEQYEVDEFHYWTLRSNDEESDLVLSKLNNRENARAISELTFSRLADWSHIESHTGGNPKTVYTTWNGRNISCDSDGEVKLLEYLEERNLFFDCGGQALEIPYSTSFSSNKLYYPDIVILTKCKHIAIIEVKPVTAMDYHINMDKYDALREYCEEHGFEYMMVDPNHNFMTFEEVRNMYVSSSLLDFFDEWNDEPDTEEDPYKHFDQSDVDEWYVLYGGGFSKTDFNLQVHSLIIFYKWYNTYQNGFNVYNRPVKVNGNNEVIDWFMDE